MGMCACSVHVSADFMWDSSPARVGEKLFLAFHCTTTCGFVFYSTPCCSYVMWVPLSNCLSQNMLFFFSFFGEGGNAKSHNIKVILTVQKQYLYPYFFHMTWQPGAENQMHFINWSSASVSTYKRRIFWHCVLIQCHELELQSSPDLEMKLNWITHFM